MGTIAIVATYAPAAHGAVPTPEFQKAVRAATFEVVVPKASHDPLVYEKPLPLELVPYAERNDAYWSIGSAVAVGPNTFVSAAHVLMAGMGRPERPTALRDAAGNIHAIDRILGFSLFEDYAVFSLQRPPVALQPLPTSDTCSIDDIVFAAGNALGEGVVIRDGLLTSLTPEPRHGNWKYLRFSAATSPGNSGGPLLDAQGRVLGVVVAKSPNENLNFALPIARVLQAPTREGVVEVYGSYGSPLLRDSTVVDFRNSFALPASQAEFSDRLVDAMIAYQEQATSQLFGEKADELFPRGATDEFFATYHDRFDPTLVAQKQDDRWGLLGTGDAEETRLPARGRVWVTSDPRFTLFRVVYPETLAQDGRYTDTQQFMDLLLKGLRLQRSVGDQAVRITSLGPARTTGLHTDAHGRVWQVRHWSLDAIESEIVVFALPTPDGYVGIAMSNEPGQQELTKLGLRQFADHFFVSYTGTLAQWRQYLDLKQLRARVFDTARVEFDAAKGVALRFPALRMTVAPSVMPFDASSRLDLRLSYVRRGDRVDWEPVGAVLEPAAPSKDYIRLQRQSKPGPDVDRKLQTRWAEMTSRSGAFTGHVRRNDTSSEYWFRTVVVPAKGGDEALYELVYSTHEMSTPKQLDDRRDALVAGIAIEAP
jgi:Trypsin-like serine proteases, typically periplasmic, contain C-terminal PDZ domain